jgi:hypothetical protein
VNWEAVGIDPQSGLQIEKEFEDVMGYPITEGPAPNVETNLGNNIAAWQQAGEASGQETVFGNEPEGGWGLFGPGGAADSGWGPFDSYEQWASQFESEHGRPPTTDDEADAWDSFDFLADYGRAPTQDEWENRWWTGEWFPNGGGGGGGGGWGGNYGGGGGGSQGTQPWWYTHMQKGI